MQKLSLATGVIAAGDYRIGYSMELTSSNKNAQTLVQVQVDDTTTIAGGMSPKVQVAGNYTVFSGFAVVTLTNAAHTIDVDYKDLDTTETATIRNVRLELYPIP